MVNDVKGYGDRVSLSPIRPVSVMFAIPALDKGGPDRVFFELLRGIDRSRFELALATSEAEGFYLQLLPEDVRVFHLGPQNGVFGRYPVLPLLQLVRRVRPDVVLATLRMVLTTGFASYLFPRATRLVVRPANHLSSNSRELIQSAPAKHRLSFILNRLALQAADHIVCQSEDIARDLGTLGIRTPMSVIANPIDVEAVVRQSTEPASLPGRPALLAVGRLTHQKGFDLLLAAFAKQRTEFPDAHLSIAGSGPEERALRELCRDLGIASSVSFRGFVANPYPLMRTADLFVLSSRYEGLPNVVIESLACGTPVLATKCPGVTDLIQPGVNGWLAPVDDPEGLANMLRLAMQKYPSLSPSAITRWVADRFGARRIIKQYEEVIAAAPRSDVTNR